jgi:cytochrome c oxidase subunit 3
MTAIDTHAHDADHGHHHDHPPHLAHHWDNPKQQFEAGKLGMWLFLATEFLLFGGLFCAYAVYRGNNPEMFEWGSQFLDTRWGAINTVILILSSLTMALAVSAAQLGRKNALIVLLSLTCLGGAGFMGIKYIEYSHKFEHNIVWGPGLYRPSAHDTHAIGDHELEDVAQGEEAAEEIGEAAPADGSGSEAMVDEVGEPGGLVDEGEGGTAPPPPGGFVVERSAIPPPAAAPQGLALGDVDEIEHAEEEAHEEEGHEEPNPRTDPNRPANAHIFFGIYFCMTGLHGLHVLAGMAVIGWLIFRSAKGHFSAEYFTPVDLGGLYWHVVDLIWIFLFPMLYLIG